MKKKRICIAMAVLLLLGCMPIYAAADLNTIVLADERQTPRVTGGYPRFETLADGTLILLAGGGTFRRSSDNGKTWEQYSIAQNCQKIITTAGGTTHILSQENWQPYVLEDGTVFAAYRSRTSASAYTSGKEFYTSIRVLKSTDNGRTFADEEILVESTPNYMHGYWEPIMMQIDENTVALYYADDLNVDKVGPQQNINYVTYDIPSGKWDKTVRTAINGVVRNSRDGMPVITKLSDGGFAMVVEAHDYANRVYGNKYYSCRFVIGLSLSADGRTWSNPIPVVVPEDTKSYLTCSAPFITTLPDGRVIISYQTDEDYVGATKDASVDKNCVYGAVISDAPLTVNTVLTASTGGAAEGFTKIPDIFASTPNGYMIWNTVYCDGKYVYFAGGYGRNNSSGSAVRIRRATVYGTVLSMTVGATDYTLNGETKTMDVAPVIRNDRTMLPVRYVAEALGADVAWDAETSTATLTTDTVAIKITVGSSTATVGGESVTLDAPAFIENDRTYMPVRFVAEALGATVSWDGATATATIRK